MSNKDSLVKANYALTILRVARMAERKMAHQLVEGLATDYPAADDRPEVVQAHEHATDMLRRLVESIGGPSAGSAPAWELASNAVERWRALVVALD